MSLALLLTSQTWVSTQWLAGMRATVPQAGITSPFSYLLRSPASRALLVQQKQP